MSANKTAPVDDYLDEETQRLLEIIDSFGPKPKPIHAGPKPNQHHPLSFLQQEESPVDLLGEE